MRSAKSSIKVQVNSKDKEEATNILKNSGINMSTAINMFLKQIIEKNGLPFEVSNPKPSKELLDALEEGEEIIKEVREGKRSGYNNVNEMMKAIK